MSYRRKTVRLIIEREGQIHRRGKILPCTVIDMSEEGVRVKAQSPVTIGEELQLDCWLVKDRSVQCTVQVTYVRHPTSARGLPISHPNSKVTSGSSSTT